MQENNPKQNSEVEDLEMGSDPAPSQTSGQNNVQVNKYTDKKAQEAPKVVPAQVDPRHKRLKHSQLKHRHKCQQKQRKLRQ